MRCATAGVVQRFALVALGFGALVPLACQGGGSPPGGGTEGGTGATGGAGSSATGGGRTGAGPWRDGSPSWSPDATKIAFYTERDGNAEIYVMNADGSDPVRLTDHPGDEGYPAFSPDGSRISFDSDRDGNFEIYTMSAGGAGVRRLTYNPARDLSAAWSPDGSTIAFVSDRSGRFEVWLMDADGANQRQFTGAGETPSEGTHWFPQWSRDGAKLAFHVDRDLHTVNADGSEYARLTVDPDNGMVPTWSPDGSRIIFMTWRTGTTEIWLMNADGTAPERLTYTERGESIDPRWSPDGGKIVYTWVPDGGAGPKHLMTMNPDGTEVRQLTGSGGDPGAAGR